MLPNSTTPDSTNNNLQGNPDSVQPNDSGSLQGASTADQFKSADNSTQPLSIAKDSPGQALSTSASQVAKPAAITVKKISAPMLYLTGFIVIVVYIVMQVWGIKKPKSAVK